MYSDLSRAASAAWSTCSRALMTFSHEAVGVELSQYWNMSTFQCCSPPWLLDFLISWSFPTGTPSATPNVYQSTSWGRAVSNCWTVGGGGISVQTSLQQNYKWSCHLHRELTSRHSQCWSVQVIVENGVEPWRRGMGRGVTPLQTRGLVFFSAEPGSLVLQKNMKGS